MIRVAATVRDATLADGPALADIYNYYIEETIVTFEEQRVDGGEMARRVRDVGTAGLPWLVAEQDGAVQGYAYATGWRARAAYRFCAEVTVYLRHGHAGRGLGSALYAALFERAATRGIHTLLGCIALPNEPSIALHEKFGLRKVAHFSEVGFKFGRWVDVGYWQKNLPGGPHRH
jgi:phosphinothricin acetyltransferase